MLTKNKHSMQLRDKRNFEVAMHMELNIYYLGCQRSFTWSTQLSRIEHM
jgi:hypothetical protein